MKWSMARRTWMGAMRSNDPANEVLIRNGQWHIGHRCVMRSYCNDRANEVWIFNGKWHIGH